MSRRWLERLMVAAAVVGAGLLFIHSGLYSVAALKPENPAVRWILRTTMERSVRHHARKVPLPNVLVRAGAGVPAEMLAVGFRHYDEMCVECHGAPGIDRDVLAHGLNPEPPELAKGPVKWKVPEVYWIIRNGIRMSGMAAYEGSHDDIDLWAIAVFVKRLPEVTPEQYREMRRAEAAE